MTFQVLVKTLPGMHGSYSYDLGTREAALLFVQRPDVWWYCFPVEEDTLDGSSWRRGGAWAPENALSAQDRDDLESGAAQVLAQVSFAGDEDDEEDDRW